MLEGFAVGLLTVVIDDHTLDAESRYTHHPAYISPTRVSTAGRPALGTPSNVLLAEHSIQIHFKEVAMTPMNGTIKRLVSDKGFGFILANDGTEYFFHNSACADIRFDDLREGQAVTFDRGQGSKGPRGENVRVT